MDERKRPVQSVANKLSRNVMANLLRVAANVFAALALPAYLARHLPVSVYAAWVLILQLASYVSFLDLGIQTVIARFIAEHEAREDLVEASQYASAGFALTAIMGFLGLILTGALAWQVPTLFAKMPAALRPDAEIGVLLIGGSLSVSLACSAYSAVFIGLQRYALPNALSVASRLLWTASVWMTVILRGGLRAMAAAVSIVSLLFTAIQCICWKRMVSHIRISLALVRTSILRQMLGDGFYLAIWSIGMLLVSGLDVTIVGHFDFPQAAFYSVAVTPTNLLLVVISSIVGPLMPASAALQTQRTPSEMGQILVRVTRYAVSFLLLVGLPMIVFAHTILQLWVGSQYAEKSLGYLRILILANMVRNICLPYSTMVVATGKQRSATLASVSEAVVNLAASLFLVTRMGALGVAYGTLIGACVSVVLHFILSMQSTRHTLDVSRFRLLCKGVLRPAAIAVPALILIVWNPPMNNLGSGVAIALLWSTLTVGIAWMFALTPDERLSAIDHAVRRFRRVAA